MTSVLCFGNLQLDILCRPVVALPASGEIRVIDAIDFMLSGNSGSCSAVLARLGVDVDIAGYGSADAPGQQLRATLHELGVGTEKLLLHAHAGTGTSVISVAPGGERSIMLVNGANELFDLDTVPDEWLREARLVSVLSVFLLPQFSGEAASRLFERARKLGARTLLNICWDVEGKGLAYLKPALDFTDYFVLSSDEGRQLTGQASPIQILEHLRTLTSGVIVLTLGADGCCFMVGNSIEYVAARQVETIDATGAGDSFIAGLSAGIIEDRSLRESVRLGCLAASFAVTGPGAYPRMPTLAELDQLGALVYSQSA